LNAVAAVSDCRSNYPALEKRRYRKLFHNFERGALAMARRGAGEQRPNSVDGLPAAADHAPDIALSELKFENGCSAARNFREHHVVRIFNQLPNNELEKFSHADVEAIPNIVFVTRAV
jgi:hypothetical protein